MNGRIGIGLVVGALLLAGSPAAAERIIVTGHGQWVDVGGSATSGIGYAYKGNLGGSIEAGFRIFDNVTLSGEFGPYTKLPVRAITEGEGVEEGAYENMLGQISIGLEPIENLRPYVFAGGGMSRFRTTYSGTGKIFQYGGLAHLFKEENVKAVTATGGIGFYAPISSWLRWGVRGRYMYNRWQSTTDMGRPLVFPKGDAFSVDLNFSICL
jgi:hypothetical protein